MKRDTFLYLQVILWLFTFPVTIKMQVCLKATGRDGNLPSFYDRGDEERIFYNHQAIVTSYEFKCCGNITMWGADIYNDQLSGGSNDDNGDGSDRSDRSASDHPGNNNDVVQMFNFQFQVWRPSPTVESDGCYSLVGENRVTSVTLSGGVIRQTPSVAERVTVQPGDVVGFRLEGSHPSANPGVIMDVSYSREIVWYGNTAPVDAAHCPFPVGSTRRLRSSTNLGPLITASIASTECPMPVISTTSLQPQTSSKVQIHNLQSTSPPLVASPTPAAHHESTTTELATNERLVEGESVTAISTPVSTGTPAPLTATSNSTIIIISSGVGVVIFLLIVLVAVGVIIYRRVDHENKGEKSTTKVSDPRASQASMVYNSTYPSSRDISLLQSATHAQDFSNSFYASDTIVDSEPIYDDIEF